MTELTELTDDMRAIAEALPFDMPAKDAPTTKELQEEVFNKPDGRETMHALNELRKHSGLGKLVKIQLKACGKHSARTYSWAKGSMGQVRAALGLKP